MPCLSCVFFPSRFLSLGLLCFSWSAVGVSIDKSDPSTVEGMVGQVVVLPCRVSPPPSSTVTVEWMRDGVPLDPARSVDHQLVTHFSSYYYCKLQMIYLAFQFQTSTRSNDLLCGLKCT